MTILIITILLVLAVLSLLLRYQRTTIVMLSTTIILIFIIGSGWMPSFLLKNLQTSYIQLPAPQWKNKNAIVLLGAGAAKLLNDEATASVMAYPRLYETLRLYLACIKVSNNCKIIITGGDALKTGKSEAEIYKDMLLHLDIPDSEIIVEPKSLNTYKNAEYTSAILKRELYDQIILVTSAIHLRRSLLYFSYFGIHATPGSAEYLTPYFSFIPLAYNFALTDFTLHENLGIIRFHLYNFFGWNAELSSAGTP